MASCLAIWSLGDIEDCVSIVSWLVFCLRVFFFLRNTLGFERPGLGLGRRSRMSQETSEARQFVHALNVFLVIAVG